MKLEGKAVKVLEEHLHLPSDSPLHVSYQTALRLLATERLRRLAAAQIRAKPYNTGVFFSVEESTRREIQALFISFLKDVEKKVRACSTTSAVYQMNFDLLPWGP